MTVVVTGGLAFDYLLTFPGHFSDYLLPGQLERLSLSFLADTLRREYGGTAGNLAYNLALLEQPVLVLAAAGHDAGAYLAHLRARGVETGAILQSPTDLTASFFAVTDQAGRQLASYYLGATARARDICLADYAGDSLELAIISPDDPAAMGNHVRTCQALSLPYIYDPGQQIPRLSVVDLVQGIAKAKVLIVNEYEWGLLQKQTGLRENELREMVEVVVITCGKNGSLIDAQGDNYPIPPVRPRQVVDPTGAGDAYRAGLIAGLRRGYPWPVCGRLGSVAAAYALEQAGCQRHVYDRRQVAARYAECFGPTAELADFSGQVAVAV
jgi:adenosine kinase